MDNNWMYNNKVGQGIECQVYDVGDGIVYKEFSGAIAKTMAIDDAILVETEFAFKMQCIAYEAGIAPEPIAIAGCGYFSRKVEPCKKYMAYRDWEAFKETGQWDDFISTVNKVFGGNIWDLHDGNVARFPDGTLCMIDFGYVGFDNTEVGDKMALELGLFAED